MAISTNSDSPTYLELNKAWKSTCKILFGEELGELKDNREWLLEYIGKPITEKSAVSGKDVNLAIDDYCKGSKFMRFDENNFINKFEPLNINEVKDIDSIVGAVQERVYYTGDLVLGNSRGVEGSSNITDSFNILNSYFLDACQNVAYSMYLRSNNFAFGVFGAALSDFMIRNLVIGPNCHRLFETFRIRESSDIYYSANLEGCSECIFCFNLNGKRNSIGNLELQKDKYKTLKEKLVAEMKESIKGKKISLFDIMSKLPKEKVNVEVREKKEKFSITPISTAFKSTFEIILKKKPGEIEDYKNYLQKHKVPKITEINDTASNESIAFTDDYNGSAIPRHRLISESESLSLSENTRSLDAEEVMQLSLLDNATLAKIAFMPLGHVSGRTSNVSKMLWNNFSASNCYSGMGFAECKETAYSFWPRQSSYIFGSAMVFDSSYCINTYYSKKMARSFEIDGCTNCSDIYFAHNCENVNDSMFCFNVKNMKNAIGNATLPLDKYKKMKDLLIEQVADEILKNKELKWDIYNIGCGKK